jgi:hypothetical protein
MRIRTEFAIPVLKTKTRSDKERAQTLISLEPA